jgi:glutamate-1-semialdehyde 2,1-aminomutase
MNLVKPADGFLQTLRTLCTEHESVLIFDEVMTGFRVGPQGVQGVLGVKPDLTTLGKVIGGGMPVGAFGGRADIMSHIAPLGGVYQAGTLSGNPVAVAAGIKTLELIGEPGFYERIGTQTRKLTQGLVQCAKTHGVTLSADHEGGMFGFYFTPEVPKGLPDVSAGNMEQFKAFFHGMLDRGVYFAPSAFEAGFVSITHDDEIVDATLAAADDVFKSLTN